MPPENQNEAALPHSHPPSDEGPQRPIDGWRHRMHEIIFEAETRAGKAFDVVLLVMIVLSVVTVMLESVQAIREKWGSLLVAIEWGFTILFSIEYVLRLLCVARPLRYARSFFGVVDLMSILPTYVSIFLHGSQALIVIRTLRLIRVFRIFKLSQYVDESQALMHALRATRAKITVFLLVLMALVVILGSLMYVVEGIGQPDSQFTSIPRSVYWAIVTVTTVGYGNIAPQTPVGQALAGAAMVLGYSIIIVPTGIFSAEIIMAAKKDVSTVACPNCSKEGHDEDAGHCKFCGSRL